MIVSLPPSPEQDVVADAAIDEVIAAAAENSYVVAFFAENAVIARVAGQNVGAEATKNLVIARARLTVRSLPAPPSITVGCCRSDQNVVAAVPVIIATDRSHTI